MTKVTYNFTDSKLRSIEIELPATTIKCARTEYPLYVGAVGLHAAPARAGGSAGPAAGAVLAA